MNKIKQFCLNRRRAKIMKQAMQLCQYMRGEIREGKLDYFYYGEGIPGSYKRLRMFQIFWKRVFEKSY